MIESPLPGWGPVRMVAAYVHRPEISVREWTQALEIPSVCHLRTRRLLIHAETARKVADLKQERWRARRRVA